MKERRQFNGQTELERPMTERRDPYGIASPTRQAVLCIKRSALSDNMRKSPISKPLVNEGNDHTA